MQLTGSVYDTHECVLQPGSQRHDWEETHQSPSDSDCMWWRMRSEPAFKLSSVLHVFLHRLYIIADLRSELGSDKEGVHRAESLTQMPRQRQPGQHRLK